MSSALLLIDIQNDYFPGGRMELEGSEEAAKNAVMILDLFRERGLPVFHIRHESQQEGATFFLPGTDGVDIHSSVLPSAGENVITKHYPNSFRETDLLFRLEAAKVNRLVVAGMMTHMCVDAGVRAATDYGFACAVLSDATATCALEFHGQVLSAAQVHGSFLAALGMAYAEVLPSADVASWL